jgi:hypothetical protein
MTGPTVEDVFPQTVEHVLDRIRARLAAGDSAEWTIRRPPGVPDTVEAHEITVVLRRKPPPPTVPT